MLNFGSEMQFPLKVCSILSLTVTWDDVSYHRTRLSQKTCYGNLCSRGVYHSNDYPGLYSDNLKELYLCLFNFIFDSGMGSRVLSQNQTKSENLLWPSVF